MIAEPAHLEQMLGRLKLTAIRDQLDSLLDEAAERELTLRETLTLFCEREIARKAERRIEMAFGLAKFPFVRDLAGFDFKAQPSLDPKQIRDLATGRFIANGETLLLLGPPGVGKTHLAVAIGRAAILAGYAVLFIQATTLVAALARAHGARGGSRRSSPSSPSPDSSSSMSSATCRSSPTPRTCSSSWSRGATSAVAY
jgi:DNA replication protein DnaC